MRTPLLYRLTRLIVRIALGVYFRKLEISGAENVPPMGPVILASNHPQSVTDALVLGLGTKRMVHYLAHSGLFSNRWNRWFLRQNGVIPVFRPQDVAESADRNIEMFAACHEVLIRQGTIGIFPEGTSAEEQRVQKLKTGTARMALQSEDKSQWDLGVKIVPVGLNFQSRRRFRSRVLLRLGPPIHIKDYQEAYKNDPVETVNTLTAELHKAIRENVVNIEHSAFDDLVRDLETVYKDELLAREGLGVPGDSKFKRDQWVSREIPRALDYFFERSPELIWRVRQLLREYRRRLERLRVKDELVRQERGASVPGAAARFAVFGALGLPFAIYGTLWNVLPYKLTGWLAERFAKDTTKIHYCQLAFGAPLYVLYYGLLLYVSYRLYGGMGTTIFALTLLPTGLFARGYLGRMARRRDKIRLGFIELHHGYYVQMLRQQRRRLIEELDAAAEQYIQAGRREPRPIASPRDVGTKA